MSELDTREWLEADGLGGFASGTVCGLRTRRYHALLLAATTPPTGRMVLVNGLEAWVTTPGGSFALSAQRYAPGAVHPDGASRIAGFAAEPWPTWRFRLPGELELEQEILVRHGSAVALVAWRLVTPARGVTLSVRPLFSGRDYHALHRENAHFVFAPRAVDGERLRFAPYEGVPEVALAANARWEPAPLWYRRFEYAEELARGLDALEDLASPGVLHFALSANRAALLLGTARALDGAGSALACADALRADERKRRDELGSPLRRAADAYLAKRGAGRTIVAGYPWFTDWGRDTFIALRGLCLATGRLDEAGGVLAEWSGAVSEGMLPNRFPDAGETPEYNAVDASLWFVVAAGEYLARRPRAPERERLCAAVDAILAGYARGTRFGIRADGDGLLAAGVPGQPLTWMDARVRGRAVTPRVGKPVEVQALWLNALASAVPRRPELREPLERGRASFAARFWNESAGALHDVVDVDHQPGTCDASFRPNQILAVGGLPLALVSGERARRIVAAVESRLFTPLGLRTLAPGSPGYAARYAGGPDERDAAYHQGTAWPWLAGPFVEAWLRVRGGTVEAKRTARERFLAPLEAALGACGLGHLPEVADAEPPHRPGGCPFQAWSLGELIRLREEVLAD